MSKLGLELGEFGLIAAIARRAGAGSGWVRAIGDDAAVLRPTPGHELVVTSDALIEDVHFRWSTTDAGALGRKALRASLSDLGAMGAEPTGFLLTLGLPARARADRIGGFVTGLLAEARRAACPLVGGDTVAAPVWTLSVTALGQVPRGRALLRSGARPGDRLLVTGTLGGSALGLALLESGGEAWKGAGPFVRRHRLPQPPWRAGLALRRSGHATAAIDLSDGLIADLGHVLQASGVGADLDLDTLPRARGMGELCARLRLDPERLSLAGGEDYELLFCVRPKAPAAAVLAKRLDCRITEIGRIRRGRGLRLWRAGERVREPDRGFEHFKTP